MPDTWRGYATDVLGYVPPMTEVNEKYVAVSKINEWIGYGWSDDDVIINWNHPAGRVNGCGKGARRNSIGELIIWNSCAYLAAVKEKLHP